ncbi:MAG TPA: PepSY domain-containing protein [Fontimonas sp.]
MKPFRPTRTAGLALLAGGLIVFAAIARAATPTAAPGAAERSEHGSLREALERNELVPFISIVDWIETHYVGKIVEVELEDEDDQINYEIDLLTPTGDMLEFEFDGRTGALLSVKGQNIERARRP